MHGAANAKSATFTTYNEKNGNHIESNPNKINNAMNKKQSRKLFKLTQPSV